MRDLRPEDCPTKDQAVPNSEACLVCQANSWVWIREGTDLCRPDYKRVFTLTRCSRCGHVMQNPVPSEDELNAAYGVSADYACYRPAWKEHGWPLWKILRQWTTSRRIRQLARFGRGHDLLEVGCGAGDFLVSALRKGWRTFAVEYNCELAQRLANAFDIDVRTGELTSETWAGKQFDVVAFWNVLEHVRNPIRDLNIAAGYLRKDGRVLLNIPTRQAAEHGLWFGEDWALLDLPRHIHFLDRDTLSRVCHLAGFRLLSYRTPFVQSAWCYYMSCKNWVAARQEANWLTLSAGLLRLFVVTLALPYIAIQCLRGRGLEAFAVAVKV